VSLTSLERPRAAAGRQPRVPPTALVVFGATGDLARRKLLPALYNLAHAGTLPERFALIGSARKPLSEEEFRASAAEAVHKFSRRPPDPDTLRNLLRGFRYLPGASEDDDLYARLSRLLAELDAEGNQPLNRAFYLSTAPALFSPIVEHLGESGLNAREGAEVRIMIEKPFGTTLAEARAFNKRVLSVFEESQVFRIDHYLGKETVQNILALRFANALFEPIWNRTTISSVQVTVAEQIGIGSRAGYYDGAGALRDMVLNHMLQLLCMMCMEPPADLSSDSIRDEKVKVLKAVRSPAADAAVRARYEAGTVGGEPVPGYLEEPGVPPESRTETYVGLRLAVDNWRWAGVPFYLRTGKRLARKETEIAVTLRPVPHLAFGRGGPSEITPNQLVLGVQPNERITIELAAKTPGTGMQVEPVTLGFDYGSSFASRWSDAYERLILDAMRGDATLFTRADEVEAQWRICDPVVRRWAEAATPLAHYPSGSQGPPEADSVLLTGDAWRPI
jgi:glucose-6-phosphate 1-dehydrogenase